MDQRTGLARKPDYGIDSPGIVTFQFVASGLAFGIAVAVPHLFGLPARWICLLAGLYFLNGGLGMLHYSKIGKLKLRDRLLNLIPWRGDEIVLDVGCGRGLLLAGAARRLTTGKAIGVDIWLPHAVSGNRPTAALENAAIEGVADRVEIKQGDVRQLPFEDASFDVAVSNFVLHEMNAAADREKMLREIIRVLKPGGRLALIDFIFTKECVDVLRRAGADNATRSRIGGLSFFGFRQS
jgi:arsenite methyltransferase